MPMSEPKEDPDALVTVLFESPGYKTPLPSAVNAITNEELYQRGGVRIVKCCNDTVVKYGTHVTVFEAENMVYVKRELPDFPAPRVHACYKVGPFDRDVDDFGSQYDTYIVMDYIPGRTLDLEWETFDVTTKEQIAHDLATHMNSLRSLSAEAPNFIGCAGNGPVLDNILENHGNRGPFRSEADFNQALVDAYLKCLPNDRMRSLLEGILSQRQHAINFTHADFRPANIIVNNGKVTGIVDWEMSGWYPEYWEFVKALYIWRYQTDWADYLDLILRRYYDEYLVHQHFARMLW